jgi:hypothetical protein
MESSNLSLANFICNVMCMVLLGVRRQGVLQSEFGHVCGGVL